MEINGKNYSLKYGLRAMFAFEEMTGKPFEIKTLLDTYCFCYSCIIACPENPALDFEEFINYCEIAPEVMDEFNDYVNGEIKKRESMSLKKKVTAKKNSQ